MNVIELTGKKYLLLAGLIMIFTDLYGQKNSNLLDTQVRVLVKEVNIDALGDMLSRQTGLILSFNSQRIGPQQKIKLQRTAYSVRELLTLIQTATGADYTIYKEHVIFHRPAATAKLTSTPPHKPQRHKARPHAATVKADTTRDTYHPPVLSPLLITRTVLTVSPALRRSGPMTVQRNVPVPPALAPPPQRERADLQLFKVFAQAGVAADETFYLNLEARAGITLLYGIGSWSSNFSSSGFRYGLGSSIALRNNWRLQLEATTGSLSKDGTVESRIDTFVHHIPIRMQSRLHRVALFVQKEISPHLVIHGGPVFNYLKTTYYKNNVQMPIGDLSATDTDEDQLYYTIKPLYTLSHSAPDRPHNIQTWIGLQAGISYRF